MKFGFAKVEKWNLGLSAGAVAASYALATPHFATSLAAGAFLEAVNLGAIHRTALRLFDGQILSGAWVGGFAFRFVALGAAIFLTMQAGAHPVAFLIGLSIALPATLIDAWSNRPPIIDPATLPTFIDSIDSVDSEQDFADEFEEAFEGALAAGRGAEIDAESGRSPRREQKASLAVRHLFPALLVPAFDSSDSDPEADVRDADQLLSDPTGDPADDPTNERSR